MSETLFLFHLSKKGDIVLELKEERSPTDNWDSVLTS